MESLTLQPNKEDAGTRLDAWLAANVEELTRSAAVRLIEEGRVTRGGKPLVKKDKVIGGETIEVALPEPEAVDVVPQNIPLDIVYEDGDVIVVNKPKGMVVHPAPGHSDGTLVNALLYHCGDSLSGIGGELRPGIVHRIDRDTTGLIIAAKTTSPTSVSPPSCRTTPSPASTAASSSAACGRIPAPWTPPSADTLWTGRSRPSWPTAAGP